MRRLRRCPTCRQEMSDDVRAHMGLRNNETLNAICPPPNGPSDIDNVLHNGRTSPERMMFMEYKNGVGVPPGQAWIFRSLREETTGRRMAIRVAVLPLLVDDEDATLRPVVDWVWPT